MIHGLCASGDIGGGEIGLVGGSGQQRADVGDGGIVAADKVLGRVGVGWRERGAQRAELLDEASRSMPRKEARITRITRIFARITRKRVATSLGVRDSTIWRARRA